MSLLIAVTPRALPAASGQVRKAGMIIWLIFYAVNKKQADKMNKKIQGM